MCTKGKELHQHTVKSLIKDNTSAVYESLLGYVAANKNLVVLEDHCIIMRRDHKSMAGKVKLIGGGGAGIEPAEAYYVGKGMLTAAVMGEIFTAPPVKEILIAIRELAEENPDGVLLLVKNYIGDKLNFQLAMEEALKENIITKMLVISDDVFYHTPNRLGRKGMAGSVLVYKIIGELAEQGKTIDEISEFYENVILDNLATESVTFTPCSYKTCSNLNHDIGVEEMLLGLGIYAKGGNKKIEMTDTKNVVSLILEEIISFLNTSSAFSLPEILSVVVLVNNLGATTKVEEGVIAKEVSTQLIEQDFKIAQFYMGTFMSTLGSQGFSVTLLRVTSEEILKHLNAPTSAPGWPVTSMEDLMELDTLDLSLTAKPACEHDILNNIKFENFTSDQILSEKASAAIKQIVLFAAEALISCEMQLNIIDTEAGDGDAGSAFKKFAEAVKESLVNEQLSMKNPAKLLLQLSELCGYVGGLSGALYSVLFRGASKIFQKNTEVTPEVCCMAFKEAVKNLKCYSKAQIGDRTLLDALGPAVDSFENAIKLGKDLTKAVHLAATTCELKSEETKYLRPNTLQHTNIQLPILYSDAGTHAASIWLRAVTFDKDAPSSPPGIFIWKFINEEEARYLSNPDLPSADILVFFEMKLGNDEYLFGFLLLETVKFIRKKMTVTEPKISALVGIVYHTHKYFTASRWRTAAEVYFYFRESILRHSVESPPVSMEIFNPDEAKNAVIFFIETYVRNLPIISILHITNYKLKLKCEARMYEKEQVHLSKINDLEKLLLEKQVEIDGLKEQMNNQSFHYGQEISRLKQQLQDNLNFEKDKEKIKSLKIKTKKLEKVKEHMTVLFQSQMQQILAKKDFYIASLEMQLKMNKKECGGCGGGGGSSGGGGNFDFHNSFDQKISELEAQYRKLLEDSEQQSIKRRQHDLQKIHTLEKQLLSFGGVAVDNDSDADNHFKMEHLPTDSGLNEKYNAGNS